MLIHADRTKPAVSFADEAERVPSPMAGVEGRMLERDGDEVARATSYRPGSRFPRHEHAPGEKFLVLEAPSRTNWASIPRAATCAIRRAAKHAPFSLEGCLLYVKIGHLPAVVT